MSFPWQRYAALGAAVVAGYFEAFKYHSYTGTFILFLTMALGYAVLGWRVDQFQQVVTEKTDEILEMLDGAKEENRHLDENESGDQGTVGNRS